MLVETAINMLLLKFNYIGRPDFSFWQLHLIMDVYDFFFFFPIPTPFFWIVDPSLFGLLVEEQDSLQQPI